MAGLSYPFDDGPGAAITEEQWSYLTRDGVGTGVHEPPDLTVGPSSNELKVFSQGEAGTIYVRAGRATIHGFHYQQGGTEALPVAANTSGTQDRIDAVVLQLDLNTNQIALAVKQGTPSSTPVPPAIDSDELLLATFRVRKNSSTVLANEVEDRRTFVGRRLQVTYANSNLHPGDISYSTLGDRWYGRRANLSTEAFAFQSELNNHISATDPHPQYLTQAEGNAAYNVTTSVTTVSMDSLFTGGYYWRSLNLPGGYKIVRFYMMLSYHGTDQGPNVRICTLNDSSFRPNFSQYYVAHQYRYSNDTGDYPMMVVVNASGDVHTYQCILQGGAFLSFSGTYFVGSGV